MLFVTNAVLSFIFFYFFLFTYIFCYHDSICLEVSCFVLFFLVYQPYRTAGDIVTAAGKQTYAWCFFFFYAAAAVTVIDRFFLQPSLFFERC